MRGKLTDLTGRRFTRLTAIARNGSDKHGTAKWLCVCDCGNYKTVRADKLLTGQVMSCGCLAKETRVRTATEMSRRNTTHGQSGTRLYYIYDNMIKRCYDASSEKYKSYGERGITVCDEWLHSREAFFKWANASGYKDNLTLDRIDVNGSYSPSNCRWATAKVQANNRRSNRVLTLNGESHTVAEWADILGVNASTIYGRIYRGLNAEQALSF